MATNNHIIIDGVDVSGCNRLNTFPMQYGEPHEICLTSLEQWGGQEKYCKDRPNCYYKQLKNKEQELEQYKRSKQASYESMQREWNNAVNENRELKAENRELKAVHSCNVALSDELFKYKAKNKRLKQTLDEIKAIAKQYTEVGVSGQSIILQYKLEGKEELAHIILNKISDVE